LGTAGHIDHGKSSLVLALTGIDPDRLKEEKQRGITIELGFAELSLGDLQVGIVDVPGHERFVRTMVAGATGIDLVVLVIAADEGVMPQTREHLDICSLLEVKKGLVAISKIDLVEPEWLELVREDIAIALHDSFLEGAALVPLSVRTGEGLDELLKQIQALSLEIPGKASDGITRLPIDRVFEQKGFGPVITGTMISGTLRDGDQVNLLPGDATGRVRGLQIHGRLASEALAGQRTAVNLQGIELQQIHRGQVIVQAGTLEATKYFDAEIRLLEHLPKPIRHQAPMLLHTGTVQIPCRIFMHNRTALHPGESALVRVFMQDATALLSEDRFILRGFQRFEGHGTTIGGGVVIDPFPAIRRRGMAYMTRLEQLRYAELEERISILVEDAGSQGVGQAELCQRTGFALKKLERIIARQLSQGDLISYEKEPPRYVHKQTMLQLAQQIEDRLRAYHAERPLEEGMSRESLREQAQINSLKLFTLLIQRMEKEERIVQDRDLLRLAGHRVRFAQEEADLQDAILEIYRKAGLTPPRARDLPELLNASNDELRPLLDLMVRRRQIVRIQDDLFFASENIDEIRQKLIDFLITKQTIDAQQFKQLTGASRKFAIPLAEYFDREKITLRIGDIRKLRPSALSANSEGVA
jgi:selenocysteine-specific elongation factor